MKKNSTLFYFVNNTQPGNAKLNKEFAEVEEYLRKAENAEMEPSKETVNTILGFARSYEVMETQKNGPVEMNLN